MQIQFKLLKAFWSVLHTYKLQPVQKKTYVLNFFPYFVWKNMGSPLSLKVPCISAIFDRIKLAH